MFILIGCVGVMLASVLPTIAFPLWWLVLPLLLTIWHRFTRWFSCLLVGLVVGVLLGDRLISNQLPERLEGEEVIITGYISDLPQDRGRYQRFVFELQPSEQEPTKQQSIVQQTAELRLPSKLLLNWYGAPPLAVGQEWKLVVKLRRPRGSVNDGGFDYQRWLLSAGFGATGYVRDSDLNSLLGPPNGYRVSRAREHVRAWLSAIPDVEHSSLLIALAVGDSSVIDPAQWGLLRDTGTSHLMAISGLHVGLLALFGFAAGKLIRRFGCWLPMHSGRWLYQLPNCLSVLFAGSYAMLAGFSLPTQRALVMIVVLNVALILNRRVGVFRPLLVALPVILVIDPLAAYDLGFWLSFGAVLVLLYGFSGRSAINALSGTRDSLPVGDNTPKVTERFSALSGMLSLARAQGLLLVGLMVPLTLLNQAITFLAPIANIVAVPVVSLLVVGPLLLGIALHFLLPDFAASVAVWPIKLADGALDLALHWMTFTQELTAHAPMLDALALKSPSWIAVIVAVIGVFWLLAPRGVPHRWLGLILLMPMFYPPPTHRSPLAVHVMDVGQGLAIIVQVKSQTLLFDTGPKSSERFNAGEAIVLPFLRKQGIGSIDTLIVSHGDNDHAGGAPSLWNALPIGEIIVGEPLSAADPPTAPVTSCDSSRYWRWQDVDFYLIEPPRGVAKDAESNDQSCILAISYRGQRIVIPGDISSRVERSVLGQPSFTGPVTLLIAAHHGSITSSSRRFVEQLSPDHVVYSAGYRNRYNHPHPKVVERFTHVGSAQWHTGYTGQLSFIWDDSGRLAVRARREDAKRYWFLSSR
ncbi:DNA internalization-related competence protein ComEC/Rec2 [Aurantivibrio plasticivorans]